MKKHIAVFFIILALAVGLASGYVICFMRQEWNAPVRVSAGDVSLVGEEPSNTSLLNAATDVLELLREGNYSGLSGEIDPERGITFTAYSTVDFSSDLVFTQAEFESALDSASDYIWGVDPASGEPLRMTLPDYISSFLWDADYSAAPEIGVDMVLFTGGTQEENVLEAYPDCRVVDFSVPSENAKEGSFRSLKLVFRRSGGKWRLTGMVHSAS